MAANNNVINIGLFCFVLGFCLSTVLHQFDLLPTISKLQRQPALFILATYDNNVTAPYSDDESIYLEKENQDDATVADILAKSVRVMCLVLSTKSRHDSHAKFVEETWGRRCDKIIIGSDEVDEAIGAVKAADDSSYNALWGKTQFLVRLAYDKYLNEFDWFLKADDDSYVIMENLRLLLSQYPPNEPIMLGRHWVDFLPGCGYVFSRMALQLVVEKAFSNESICKTNSINGYEDQEMNRCLRNAGVMVTDSRDFTGRQRFYENPPDQEINHIGIVNTSEFYPFMSGPDSLSLTPVVFHYFRDEKAQFMRTLDVLLYNVRVFGLSVGHNLQPKKLSQTLAKRGYRVHDRNNTKDKIPHALKFEPSFALFNMSESNIARILWTNYYTRPQS